MSERLSDQPDFTQLISDHNRCLFDVHSALAELKETTDPARIALAAEILVEQQMRMPYTYQNIATAYINTGRADIWVDDFVEEDERAIWRMFEDLHTSHILGGDDDMTGDEYFNQASREELMQLAHEHTTNTTTPHPIPGVGGFITPEFSGSDAIRYEYGFKLNQAIESFVETLPEPARQAIESEMDIHRFREMLAEIDNPIDRLGPDYSQMDDGELLVKMYSDQMGDTLLSNAIADHENAKTNLSTTLEEIMKTNPVRIKVRYGLYATARENTEMLAYHLKLLGDVLHEKYQDKKLASRILAAQWRQDKSTFGMYTIDEAINVYADYFMGIPPAEEDDLGGRQLTQRDVIGYYEYALDMIVEKAKKAR